MSKIKTGYKIIKDSSNDIDVQYKLNEWVQPNKKYGPLAVFTNIKDMKKFKNDLLLYDDTIYLKIFRCEYKRSKHRYLKDFSGKTHKRCLPAGTDFADAVKLLEEIRID